MWPNDAKFSLNGSKTDFLGEAQSDPMADTESVLEYYSWFLLALKVIDEISNNACSSSLQRQSGSSGG